MAVRDRALADAIARAVVAFDRSLILFGLPGSELLRAGAAAGLRVASEGFADRAYEPDGSLPPRTRAGRPSSTIPTRSSPARSAWSRDGQRDDDRRLDAPLPVDTICVHGDTPGAAELTRRLRDGLENGGIAIRACRLQVDRG